MLKYVNVPHLPVSVVLVHRVTPPALSTLLPSGKRCIIVCLARRHTDVSSFTEGSNNSQTYTTGIAYGLHIPVRATSSVPEGLTPRTNIVAAYRRCVFADVFAYAGAIFGAVVSHIDYPSGDSRRAALHKCPSLRINNHVIFRIHQ